MADCLYHTDVNKFLARQRTTIISYLYLDSTRHYMKLRGGHMNKMHVLARFGVCDGKNEKQVLAYGAPIGDAVQKNPENFSVLITTCARNNYHVRT